MPGPPPARLPPFIPTAELIMPRSRLPALFILGLMLVLVQAAKASEPHPQTEALKSTVWMCPPAKGDGAALRALFEHPDQWQATRSAIDVLGYPGHMLHKQFSDDELRRWFALLQQWNLKLSLEVGAVKPWGPTGAKTFAVQRPNWRAISAAGRKGLRPRPGRAAGLHANQSEEAG